MIYIPMYSRYVFIYETINIFLQVAAERKKKILIG